MKNTLIPLDMLFIDNHGIITGIAKAKALSTDIIASPDNTRAVLEIGGGEAARNHIATGDKVIYSIFP